MSNELSLSLEERRVVEAACAALQKEHGLPGIPSLDRLLRKWSRIVVLVEAGYILPIADYLNDLDAREIIEAILRQIPESISNNVLDIVDPLDRRFIAATMDMANPLISRLDQWWNRVPQKLSEEAQYIEDWLVHYPEHWFPVSMRYMIDWWCAFVTRVEQGALVPLGAYTYDLYIRDRIQRYVHQLGQSLESQTVDKLTACDARFQTATRPIPEPLQPRGIVLTQPGIWYYRIPKKIDKSRILFPSSSWERYFPDIISDASVH